MKKNDDPTWSPKSDHLKFAEGTDTLNKSAVGGVKERLERKLGERGMTTVKVTRSAGARG